MAVNVKQVVPFLRVSSMERSIRYYIDGLGFSIRHKWVVDGKLRWCWLERGRAALMLEEGQGARAPAGKVGQGVSLCFTCEDAVAFCHEIRSAESKRQSRRWGNARWVTCLAEPDGYRLNFESTTETPGGDEALGIERLSPRIVLHRSAEGHHETARNPWSR
jgi:hypothetical protein